MSCGYSFHNSAIILHRNHGYRCYNFGMNKKFSIFLILSFLSLQTFSFLHQAEFGFEEHEHDKNVCEIYLNCKQSKDNISNAALSLQELKYFTFAYVLERNFLIYSKKYRLISTRAPPQFS